MNPTQQPSTVTNGGGGKSVGATKPLFVTHVTAFGPYLKIYGQLNRDAMTLVRSKMLEVLPSCFHLDASNWQLAQQQLLLAPGTKCLYKRVKGAAPADCEVLRTRIVNIVGGSGGSHIMQVEVEFIDYGYSAVVASSELLFPQHPKMMLQNIPTMCSQFIALGVCKDWNKSELDEVSRMIKQQTVEICIQMEFNQFKFITLKWKEFNFAEFLIHQKKIGAPIANDLLRDNFIKMLKQQQQLQTANGSNNNNNYYANKNNNNYNGGSGGNSNSATVTGLNNRGGTTTEIGAGRGANQVREQMAARRSMAARLQQQQQQQQLSIQMQQQNILMHALQPRVPASIGNLRSMMQSIHMHNNATPYGSPRRTVGIPYPDVSGSVSVIPTVAPFNNYNARYQYQMSAAPQPLVMADYNAGVTISNIPVSPPRTTATFKSNNLTVGHVYDVCVSFVENGPCLFSVQLATAQDELTEMMNRIERVQLRQFNEKPVLGTACIARYSEDGQLYRALITGVQPTACKVAYIDYGNAELVNFRDLYIIPDEFLLAKAYAIRFTLSGNKELEPIDESLKKAFKDLVIYKNFQLKVMPLEGPPLVQYCELYSQQKNILDVLKQIQKCRLVYAKAEALKNNDIVEIRYIDSPKHFYVQKVSNIAEFEMLMDDMFLYYNKNQLVPNHLALGAPCIVKYENEWYRAEVMRADAAAIIVRHVDFGYEQKVTKNLLSTIAEKHLKLPRQAVQCCLKGFENNELNKDLATTQFEMLAEESNRKRRSFTVKVFRIQPDGVNLVNLCTKDLNVMKKLYKLSMPFEQYLTLEKEEFNVHNGNQQRNGGGSENGHRTPSIASSDALSVLSGKKTNFLNSTPLHNEERMVQQQQQKQKSPPQQHQQLLRISNNNSQASFSTEWDKNSSASSMDNRDSRSSSSEHKQGKRQQHQQQHQQQRQSKNMLNVSGSSYSDRRSTGSGGSGGGAGSQQKIRGAAQATNGGAMSPHYQHDNRDNRRNNRQQQQVTTPQQRGQRPQNAPQGYSQQRPNKANSSLNRSSDSHVSSASEPSPSPPQHQQEAVPEEYAPLDRAFPCQHIETPLREEVTICWWISPHQFYTHLKSRSAEFEQLMRDMQQFYKRKPAQHLQLKVGCHVVARNRKDNVVYRARILACNQMLRKYKVHFVDFGNQYTVTSEDIWRVEKRFADLPCMAYLCSFNGVVSNFDHLYIIDRMEKYLPAGATLVCEYFERAASDMYYVNVHVNKVSLKATLKSDNLITEVCPELRLDLLAGQQIRAKFSSVKDMLNFKIQIEGCDEVQLLCSYDDVRYVKSNPDIAQKFKQFYEDKSFVVNIKDVNDNKVILLRPLMPLLKDDIPTYLSTYPIILETFQVRVVYIASAYRLYAHAVDNEFKVSELLDNMYAHYEKGGNALEEFVTDEVCAAQGSDGNWYRARIVTCSYNKKEPIEVYYIDYGNREQIERSNLKQLEEKFYLNHSAYGLEINLPLRTLAEKGKSKQKSASHEHESDAAVTKVLDELLLQHAITVNALEVHNNRLIADIILPDRSNKNLVDVLKQKQLIRGRDVDYMRKLLDKEKPNMLEYIEMVDLTLEDEDEVLEKPKNVTKAKTTSPKKKKPAVKAEDKTEKLVEKLIEKPKQIVAEPTAIITETKMQTTNEVAKDTAPAVHSAVAEPQTPPNTPKTASIPTTPITNPVAVVAEPSSPPSVVELYADMEHAVLSHCDNPAQFYVHPQEKLDDLHKLQENLQIVSSLLPPLKRVVNGAHCISLYSVDKQWYRAKIMDAELMVLQFIDFGNTDCVTDSTGVKEMSVFPDIEPLCMPCALPIKPNGTADWVDAANAIFNDSYSKELYFEYITRGDIHKRSYINLFIEGVNIAEKLIQDGFAKPLEVIDSGENCYISHVNGLTDFYIQYEKDSKALELIEIYLADNGKLKKQEKFERSKIVAALFPDDEMWYRAKLLQEVPNKGYEVLFIDYGNTSISPECREISQDIATLPPLSKKCALELPEQCVAWSDAAEEKFAEIAALGETIFTVELREPGVQHANVHLLIDGHNINDDLEPLCEQRPVEAPAADSLNVSLCSTTLHTSVYEPGTRYDGVVSQVNSPNDFYVQFNKDAARLDDMTSSLNSLGMDALAQPKVGELCAAVFPVDNSFYRARILEVISAEKKECRVLFVDFGNEAVSSDLRVLPEDLLLLREFSKRCQLAHVVSVAQLEGVAIETFNALIDGCQGLVKIECLDEAAVPAVVKLYATNTGENLGEKLSTLLGMITPAATATAETTATKANTCLISHAISPTDFYVQLKANSPQMEIVAKLLQQSKIEQLPLLTSVELGRVCSVYCSEDDCYYRGRVKTVLAGAGGYEIYLLDYGNTIVSTQLRELPEELRAIPALALKCKLNAVPNAADAVLEEHFAALLEAHFGEIYEIEADEVDEVSREHTLKLQVNYKDLAEELAKAVESGATQVEALATVPTLHDCTIIHVNSPTSFYIQLSRDVAAVEQITDVLLDAETDFKPYAELRVGAICAAQFPEDSAYYRAEIVQVLEEGKCEVHYLDFGNNSVTDQFRALPENLLHAERYSKHCALKGNFSSAEACAEFQALVDSRFSETFQAEFLKLSDELNICRLFYQDKNVATELAQRLKGIDDSWRMSSAVNPSSGVGSMVEECSSTSDTNGLQL